MTFQIHVVAQGGKDKGRRNLREAAKTKLPDESANFSEDEMESNHAPAPLPLIECNRAASWLESVFNQLICFDYTNSAVRRRCNFFVLGNKSDNLEISLR